LALLDASSSPARHQPLRSCPVWLFVTFAQATIYRICSERLLVGNTRVGREGGRRNCGDGWHADEKGKSCGKDEPTARLHGGPALRRAPRSRLTQRASRCKSQHIAYCCSPPLRLNLFARHRAAHLSICSRLWIPSLQIAPAPSITIDALASQFWARLLSGAYAGPDAAAEALLGAYCWEKWEHRATPARKHHCFVAARKPLRHRTHGGGAFCR
jgi:hypothetical protein